MISRKSILAVCVLRSDCARRRRMRLEQQQQYERWIVGGQHASPARAARSSPRSMSKWQSDYSSRTGDTVTYGAIGSGGGIEQITARTVDFGASDAPLTPDQQKAGTGRADPVGPVVHGIPSTTSTGVPERPPADGPTLANIYLGNIAPGTTRRSRSSIRASTCRRRRSRPVYRSDGSGDTYVLTDYLSKVSPEWKSKVGVAPGEVPDRGRCARATTESPRRSTKTDGAIGYVGRVLRPGRTGSTRSRVQNAAGNSETPTSKTIAAAATPSKSVPPDNAISITDPPASATNAYPLSTFTYVLVPSDSSKADALKKFITYAIGPGQEFGPDLLFAPLPKQVAGGGQGDDREDR